MVGTNPERVGRPVDVLQPFVGEVTQRHLFHFVHDGINRRLQLVGSVQ